MFPHVPRLMQTLLSISQELNLRKPSSESPDPHVCACTAMAAYAPRIAEPWQELGRRLGTCACLCGELRRTRDL